MRCLTMENEVKGLETYQRDRPSMVLTDIKMHGKNGFEVLRRVKAIDPQTDVIVIPGHGDKDLARQALDVDARAFFNKPLDTEAFEKAIGEIQARLVESGRTKQST